jgi:hypothetical protein
MTVSGANLVAANLPLSWRLKERNSSGFIVAAPFHSHFRRIFTDDDHWGHPKMATAAILKYDNFDNFWSKLGPYLCDFTRFDGKIYHAYFLYSLSTFWRHLRFLILVPAILSTNKLPKVLNCFTGFNQLCIFWHFMSSGLLDNCDPDLSHGQLDGKFTLVMKQQILMLKRVEPMSCWLVCERCLIRDTHCEAE